jgi:hypothetical protein
MGADLALHPALDAQEVEADVGARVSSAADLGGVESTTLQVTYKNAFSVEALAAGGPAPYGGGAGVNPSAAVQRRALSRVLVIGGLPLCGLGTAADRAGWLLSNFGHGSSFRC